MLLLIKTNKGNFAVLLAFVLPLALLSTAIYSVALGVSPETREVCMGPGEVVETSFFPSTDSSIDLPIDVKISSKIDLRGNASAILAPMTSTEYILYVVEPPVGYYTSDVYFCAGDLDVKYCLNAKLVVNVTDACKADDFESLVKENKMYIQIGIGALVALGVAYLLKKQ
jgi:hypothetical protein